MEDKEKILRWNLQEALKTRNDPVDIGGMLIASVALGIRSQREEHIKKCQKELNDYLKD